ncbi:McrC family protein [Shewanella sp. SP2S2-4]|uniref:McrC family protein n=1 Tax=Shewanella sp. SP2S2-4 TaxID=3063539 RepID=UPI0028905D3C|nr:McrC family protein [Shewanella sp. SP2S2-4]MDT3275902.1 McrC family protein [Shewanella sp. SP2S2-4]
MKAPIKVREYGRLTTRPVAQPSLALAQIEPADFDWLCQLSKRYKVNHEPALTELEDSRTLQLDSYVGVIETPTGQVIEILPKTANDGDSPELGRELIRRMLESSLDLPSREVTEASLDCFNMPLSEWVMARFLTELDQLVKRGVRSDYQRRESIEPFLRGQLDVVRQMRQPPRRGHHFALRYDIFLPDRAENRLLKLALETVENTTQHPDNRRLAQELRHLLAEIPMSRDVEGDFRLWRCDRLMAHYQRARPWCELILYRAMPSSLHGEWRGVSLLFPMEKLFERYVEACLREQLLPGASLKAQAGSQFLCSHQGKTMFQLQPDLLLHHGTKRWILDIKWKRLNSGSREENYGISQSDLYQLFAYGHKYLHDQDEGHLVLIYPSWIELKEPLEPFHYDKRLTLWVLPFELDMSLPPRLVLPSQQDDSLSRLSLPVLVI